MSEKTCPSCRFATPQVEPFYCEDGTTQLRPVAHVCRCEASLLFGDRLAFDDGCQEHQPREAES